MLDRIPDERKDQARGHRDRAHEFFTEEYFPEERRDQFIYRLKKVCLVTVTPSTMLLLTLTKKVIIECQKHKDYQESIQWLLNYVEEYANHGQTIANHGKDSHQALRGDESVNQAGRELRTLLERFANGASMDSIWNAINALIEDSKHDQELREWFTRVDAYIRKVRYASRT
jgi:hypothetical protein